MVKKIKKNKYQQTVEAVLDLHGLTKLEAEAAMENFLLDCRQAGCAKIRVITGKGINSQAGQPILKPWAETWLSNRRLPFRPAKINEGGEGALDINLS